LGGTINCLSANSMTTFTAKIKFEKVAIEEPKDNEIVPGVEIAD